MTLKNITLRGFLAERFPAVAYLVGAVGVALSVLSYIQNSHHFFYAYLVAYCFYLAITLGSMFFVIIQHLSRAGWSVVVRRIPELIMNNIALMALFFVPIIFGMHDLYHWTDVAHVQHDPILLGKSGYLNQPFFLVRAVVFFALWAWLANKFFKKSVEQDLTSDKFITLNLQKASTYAVLIYALTQTFAIIDWVMSITPHWYSTMFGVYFFAVSMVVALAFITFIFMLLRRSGFLTDIVTVEHYHDLGKLLYGFNIFWTYIAFSQYFLIWYANIPEETVWFMEHFNGSWNTVAIVLALGHFVVPFLGFMSRHAKRNLAVHFGFLIWMFVMTYVDLYWIIMPAIDKAGISFSLMHLAPFVGIGGFYIGALFNRMKKHALIPEQDPRLEESLSFENA